MAKGEKKVFLKMPENIKDMSDLELDHLADQIYESLFGVRGRLTEDVKKGRNHNRT